MSNPNFQAKLTSAGGIAIQADSLPLASADLNGRPGWLYTKGVGDGAADKFNWYFYAGTYEDMKCEDVASIYFLGSIDKWTNLHNELPHFILYTKLTGTDDQAVWYHSKHTFTLHKDTHLVRVGEKCLFHCLTEPRDKFQGARQIPFSKRTDTGAWDLNNEVLYVTLHSESGAVEASVYAETLGMDMRPFSRRIGDSHIHLNLVV